MKRRPRARVGDGRIETGSATIALKRLIAEVNKRLGALGSIELRKAEGKYSALVIHRDDKPSVEYTARKSERNLILLAEFAHIGLKMTWAEIRAVTGWTTFNT